MRMMESWRLLVFPTLIAVDYWRSGAMTGKWSSGTNMQLNLYRIINVGEKQRGMLWFRIHGGREAYRFSCSV